MVRVNPPHREWKANLSSVQEELQRLLERSRDLLPGYWPAWLAARRAGADWAPAIDLHETPEELLLFADLPGVDAAAIHLTIDGRVLTLTGERPREPVGLKGSERMTERAFGRFYRQIELSCDVDAEAIKAEVHGGVLEVRLPKSARARSWEIPVQAS
jgi:HSP20 family protein